MTDWKTLDVTIEDIIRALQEKPNPEPYMMPESQYSRGRRDGWIDENGSIVADEVPESAAEFDRQIALLYDGSKVAKCTTG